MYIIENKTRRDSLGDGSYFFAVLILYRYFFSAAVHVRSFLNPSSQFFNFSLGFHEEELYFTHANRKSGN